MTESIAPLRSAIEALLAEFAYHDVYERGGDGRWRFADRTIVPIFVARAASHGESR